MDDLNFWKREVSLSSLKEETNCEKDLPFWKKRAEELCLSAWLPLHPSIPLFFLSNSFCAAKQSCRKFLVWGPKQNFIIHRKDVFWKRSQNSRIFIEECWEYLLNAKHHFWVVLHALTHFLLPPVLIDGPCHLLAKWHDEITSKLSILDKRYPWRQTPRAMLWVNSAVWESADSFCWGWGVRVTRFFCCLEPYYLVDKASEEKGSSTNLEVLLHLCIWGTHWNMAWSQWLQETEVGFK